MDTIYNLQKRAEELRQETATDSITPETVGGLHADTLDYIADMEQNAEGLGVHQVYKTVAAMTSEGEAPVGTNGKKLRYGQLVAVYDGDNAEQTENGNVYAWQTGTGEAAWRLMGHIGDIAGILAKIEAEAAAREAADKAFEQSLNAVQTALEEKITDEINNRTEADASIADAIDNEREAREAAVEDLLTKSQDNDDAIKAETAAREEAVKEITDSIGEPGGIAPLDEDGKIAEQYIPEDVGRKQVVTFSGTVAGVAAQMASTNNPSYIVYDCVAKRFYAAVKSSGSSMSIGGSVQYFNNWLTRGDYQDEETNEPNSGVLFVDLTNVSMHTWGGTDLINLSGAKMVAVTQDEYDAMAASGTLDENTYYYVLED